MAAASRDWYLAALGIVQYRPRAVAAAGSGDTTDTPVAAEPPLAEPRVPMAVGELLASPPRVAAGAPTQPPAQESATLSFRLACWRPSADVLVLDSLASRQHPDADRLQLLTNILRAIRRLPASLPAPEFIDWPLGSAPGGRAEAATLLEMFLQGRCQQQPFRWVLAMGEVPALLLGQQQPGAADWRQRLGQRMALAIGATAIFTPGLGDMVADPATKAIAWAALRFLADQPAAPAAQP